jgi:crossover junction endodeoxyribonuclease RuvC
MHVEHLYANRLVRATERVVDNLVCTLYSLSLLVEKADIDRFLTFLYEVKGWLPQPHSMNHMKSIAVLYSYAMRILAIDPGYERLGIAVIEKGSNAKETLVYSDCFKTDKELPHYERLGLIGTEVKRVIDEYRPEALSIEDLFFAKNQKTAILVAEARGAILYQAAAHGLKVYEYGPGQIKVAVTGYGKSDKEQIIAMVPRLIKIDKAIKHDDEYDAIAVGLTCFAIERF